MRKLLFTLILLIGGLLSSSTFARELNSSNIGTYCTPGNTTCDLSNQSITSIASNTFNTADYTILEYLSLNSNQITNISSGTFSGLQSLIGLYLDNNLITSIEPGDFSGLPSLQYLYLNSNQITNIGSGTFSGLPLLLSLDLEFNQITNIGSNGFSGLPNLQYLLLYNNQIKDIGPGAFNGLIGLITLALYSNELTSIISGEFTNLPSLTSLDFSSNRIVTIEPDAFGGLPALNTLYFYSNCFDIGAMSQSIIDILDPFAQGWQRDYEFVCAAISYNPSTSTSGPVTGTLIFTGGNPINRAVVTAENSSLSSYAWTVNGDYGFDLSSISDASGYLHHTNMGYSILTGTVTRILAPTLNSFFDDCVPPDNVLCSRTNVGFNSFDYGNARTNHITIGQIYGLTINAKNTAGESSNRIQLPGGHILKLPENIDPDATAPTQHVTIKYFMK